MNTEELKLKIIQVEDNLQECKAAIKDAAYMAVDTEWKKLWLARYSALLPNAN